MREKMRVSVLGKRRLLETSLKISGRADSKIVSACASQGALARLEIQSEKISGSSLNSLKQAADLYIEDGGWAKLDSLRRSVSDLAPERRSRQRIQDSQIRANNELQNKLAEADRLRLRLNKAYSELMRLARSHVAHDPHALEALARHQVVWGDTLGFSSVPSIEDSDD